MMKHAFGLFKRKEKKVKLVDADSELDHEFREGLQDAVEAKAHYEELLRVATRSAQQAQGFAQSQQDLAACFVETLGTVDDPDIADCFKRLGRVQGEIAKLLDNYSGHLNETIIKPTEELQHKLEQMEASRKVFEEKK